MNDQTLSKLDERLGRVHARQRLGIEADHEAQVFGQGLNFFHIENWYSSHSFIRWTLRLTGLYGRGRRNAEKIQLRHNEMRFAGLPPAFDGFTLLHISDPHADISAGAMRRLEAMLPGLDYDVAVLTGDYRGATFGPFEASLDCPGTGPCPPERPRLWRPRQSRHHPHGAATGRDGHPHAAQRVRHPQSRG